MAISSFAASLVMMLLKKMLIYCREVNSELDTISSQIDMLQSKIDSVRGNPKATRVLAPSRFPELSSFKDFSYQSLFKCDQGKLPEGTGSDAAPAERRRTRRLIVRPFEESNLTK